MNRFAASSVFALALAAASAAPAFAIDGEVVITQAKALAGNVTPGDAPGFPVTISRSGVYKFGSNLVPQGDAIVVNARFVTIDLNGFAIDGHWRGDGIVAGNAPAFYAVTIKNGTVANVAGDGINALDNANWTVTDVVVRGFSDTGVKLGAYARIQNTTVVFADIFNGGIRPASPSTATCAAMWRASSWMRCSA